MDAEALIKAVEKRKCLYDKTDDGYSNRNLTSPEWRKVAKEIECSATKELCKSATTVEIVSGIRAVQVLRWQVEVLYMFERHPEQTVQNLRFDGTDVRIYKPKQGKSHLSPCVVYFHGGGWSLFSIDLIIGFQVQGRGDYKMHSQWRCAQDWRKQGMPLTTGSDEACKLYDAIVTQYAGWYDEDNLGGMEGTLTKLKAADPDFVMGQVVANGLELLGTGRNITLDASLREDVNQMVKQGKNGKGLTDREQKHVAALEQWANGFTYQAASTWEDILLEYPHDVLALKFAHDTYFYLGESNQIRDSIARVLPQWKPTMPLYGYILGMHSFGLEETNLYPEAESTARKALSINARDAWATHTLCHVMEMTGRQHEGVYMMEKTQQHWMSCGMLACHNSWHWALYYIELGDYESALSIFDKEVTVRASNSGAMLDIVDVCSLLYRLEMEGVNIGTRWESVYQVCKSHLHDHILAFNDLHILLSCLGAGQKQAVDEMMKSIEKFVRDGQGTNRDVTAEVGENLMKAFVAYNDGDFSAAVDLLNPIRYKVIHIGGSHAQRDLVNLFLIQAAIKSGKKQHHKLARALLNERKVWKPNAPMTDRLMAKAVENHSD